MGRYICSKQPIITRLKLPIPSYPFTKDALNGHDNRLKSNDLGSRSERWMVGVSTMSGCPVGCKFCATGNLKKCRNLTASEIIEQVTYIIQQQDTNFVNDFVTGQRPVGEFKINYTRMGEPFLNIDNVKKAINYLDNFMPNVKIHHYISTIGVKGSDFSWIKDNVTLQFSIHSFEEDYRDWLIPFKHKMSLKEIGQVRTGSNLKTTLNLTLARPEDFNIDKLKEFFDPKYFFIKLSPINKNSFSENNNMGSGVIKSTNII